MTKNKRFIIKPYEDTFNKVIIDELDQYRFPPLQHDFSNVRFRNALNGLWEHNQELTEENERLKSENQYLKSLKWNQDCIKEISINMQQKQLLERQNNEVVKENEKLKSDIILIEKRADTVYDEIEQIKKDLKVVLPVLLAIDFKMSVNECKVMNRLAELLDDDFVKGVDVND